MNLTINLLPAARARLASRRREIRLLAFAAAVYIAGAAIASVLVCARGATLADDPDRQIEETQTRLDRVARRTTEARARFTAASATLSKIEASTGYPDWSALLKVLGDRKPEEVILDGVEVAVQGRTSAPTKPGASPAASRGTGYAVVITGIAPRTDQVSEFVLALESSGVFDRVVQREAKGRTVRGVNGVGFRVECQLLEKGAGK